MATDKVGYSIAESCEQLGVSRTTFNVLMQKGEIAFVKVGARTIIPASELGAYLERHTVRQGATSGPDTASELVRYGERGGVRHGGPAALSA